MNQNLNRKQKIKYLKGLAAGVRTIQELIEERHMIVLDCEDEPGAVYEPTTGRRFNSVQVEKWRLTGFLIEI